LYNLHTKKKLKKLAAEQETKGNCST